MTSRTIREIAEETLNIFIADNVKCFGARPYLEAMAYIETPNDSFGLDSGRSIVTYFLVNASTWRGPDARRIKAELKKLLGKRHGKN